MKAASRNDFDVLRIKNVCSCEWREVFQALDWDKMLPATSLPENVIEKTSVKYPKVLRRLNGRR
jgi:hypothetical protein